MKTSNHELGMIEKQLTVREIESGVKFKCYNFDEAIDLAGELKTYRCAVIYTL